MLHVSEMADGVLTEPYSYVKRGDQVTVRVARIESDRRRRIDYFLVAFHQNSPTYLKDQNRYDRT